MGDWYSWGQQPRPAQHSHLDYRCHLFGHGKVASFKLADTHETEHTKASGAVSLLWLKTQRWLILKAAVIHVTFFLVTFWSKQIEPHFRALVLCLYSTGWLELYFQCPNKGIMQFLRVQFQQNQVSVEIHVILIHKSLSVARNSRWLVLIIIGWGSCTSTWFHSDYVGLPPKATGTGCLIHLWEKE